jgi:hypothetical protein
MLCADRLAGLLLEDYPYIATVRTNLAIVTPQTPEVLVSLLVYQLLLLDHVHMLHTCNGTLGGLERFAPQYGMGDALDCAVILFNNVVATRDVTDYDCGAVLFLGARDSRCIGRLVMEGDHRANGLQ